MADTGQVSAQVPQLTQALLITRAIGYTSKSLETVIIISQVFEISMLNYAEYGYIFMAAEKMNLMK